MDKVVIKCELREKGENKPETTLQAGDMVAYDENAHSIVIFRPAIMNFLEIDGDDKQFIWQQTDVSFLMHTIATLLAAVSGLAIEPLGKGSGQFTHAYRFIN